MKRTRAVSMKTRKATLLTCPSGSRSAKRTCTVVVRLGAGIGLQASGAVVVDAVDGGPGEAALRGEQHEVRAGLEDGEHGVERVELLERPLAAGPAQDAGDLVRR